MSKRWCVNALAWSLFASSWVNTSALAVDPKGGTTDINAFDFDFFGQLQLDTGKVSMAGTQMLSVGDVVHSLKLGLGTKLSDRLSAQVEVNVSADGDVSLDDSYLRYAVSDNTSLTIGHYKVHHSLSAATSELDGGLPERSMVSNAFEVGTGGQLGMFLHSHGDRWSLQTGVSLDDLNDGTAATNGWGLHGRVIYTPILSDGAFLHFGLSAYYRDEDDDLLSLSAQPEAWLDGDDVFTNGHVVANHYRHANAELATSRGAWLVQAEYGGLRPRGQQSSAYDGGYIAASYVLTGEHRSYDAVSGALASLRPFLPVTKGGAGAWEIAARYSRLDLRDDEFGNSGHSWSASLNWYLSETMRLMLSVTDFSANGDSRQNGQTIGIRTQLSW